MRFYLPLLLLFVLQSTVFGQSAKELIGKGLEEGKKENFQVALEYFDQAVKTENTNYKAWFYRGLTQYFLDNDLKALQDFDTCIFLAPDFAEAYVRRGNVLKAFTLYEEAYNDYSAAIRIDSSMAGYYNRARLYEIFGKPDLACSDYETASELGHERAAEKLEECSDTSVTLSNRIYIASLKKRAEDPSYGFTSENPIMVGNGVEGGAANQRQYLNLLRDAQGNRIKYERQGSCCGYESENGFMGYALLDRYEITYRNKKGRSKKAIVYISLYDYKEPMILDGFNTIEPPKR